MSEKLILAHDFGTSGVKACIFDTEGNFLAEAYDTYSTEYPREGYAEHNPEDWWTAMTESTRQVMKASGVAPENIKAISFSSHGMGAIPIDRDGRVLTDRVMIWSDARSTKEADFILKQVGVREHYEMTGNSFDLSMYPAAKILWIRKHLPDVFRATYKFIGPKEYLIHRMTGVVGYTDYGEAGMSGLYNLNTHRWDPALMELSCVEEDKLCQVVDGTHVMGGLTRSAAREMGLRPDTPVVLGSWDNYACATGGGVRKKGEMVMCLGTAGWMGINHEKPIMTPENMTNVVYVGNSTYFTSIHSHAACASYDWVIQNMCAYLEKEEKPLKAAERLASSVPAGSERLFFLPAMFAGNTFYSSSALCGTFVGLKMMQNNAHLIRAAMEGVGFDLMMGTELLRKQGILPEVCNLIGGGANSDLWRQILADMGGVKMMRPKNLQHIGALGAALIAGVGTGLIQDFDMAAEITRTDDIAMPDSKDGETYQRLLPVYRHFYEQLMPVYSELQKVRLD